MNIILCGSHAWPVPSPPNTGHRVYLDLAIALRAQGHDVQMIAPYGTDFDRLLDMPCAHGTGNPSAEECEAQALKWHMGALRRADVIHDWSDLKTFAQTFPEKSVSTVMSGAFNHPSHGKNVCVWTNEMRERALRGASDYEGTEFTQWHSVSRPLRDARVVAGGVDTEFWCPAPVNMRGDHMLWLGRFHPARGYALAIETAKRSGFDLVLAGEHPDDATNDHQRECALEAEALAAGSPLVEICWLPKAGHREAVREQYRRARGFLMTPRFREPFGLQQAEALACGTPVVGLRIGSVPEVVDHGVTGLVVEPWYLAQACEKIGAIDPARCREEAVRRFDRSVMAARYAELYAEVAAGGSWG